MVVVEGNSLQCSGLFLALCLGVTPGTLGDHYVVPGIKPGPDIAKEEPYPYTISPNLLK